MARQNGKTWCGWNYTGFRRDNARKKSDLFEHLRLSVVSYEKCDCKNCLKAFHAFARSIIENDQVESFLRALMRENRKLQEAKEATS